MIETLKVETKSTEGDFQSFTYLNWKYYLDTIQFSDYLQFENRKLVKDF